MSFDAEKEITKLWRSLHGAQDEIGKTYMRWRQIALELAGPQADPLEVSLKAAERMGLEIGKSWLPRLNWTKGEEAWLMGLAQNYAGQWINHGAVVKLEKGEKPFEVFLKWERCPWPSYAKEYGVPMEEDRTLLRQDFAIRSAGREYILQCELQYRNLESDTSGPGSLSQKTLQGRLIARQEDMKWLLRSIRKSAPCAVGQFNPSVWKPVPILRSGSRTTGWWLPSLFVRTATSAVAFALTRLSRCRWRR